MIDLSNYETTGGSIQQLQKDLYTEVGENIWASMNQTTMRYIFLKKIVQTQSVENNDESVRQAIGLFLKSIDFEPTFTDRRGLEPAFYFFDHDILGFYTPPKYNLSYITDNVREHLKIITEYVKTYENINCIKDYLSDTKAKMGTDERTIRDFYLRCVSEQKKILHYYLYGTKDRAFEKSREEAYFPSNAMLNMLGYRDFPYTVGKPYYDEYFLYERISDVSHRINRYAVGHNYPAMMKLYKDKGSFYQAHFTTELYGNIDNEILHLIKKVPPIRNRIEIFEELIKLYQAKQWTAFYGLGLSQIEGLFTDMAESIDANKNFQGLTDKVLFVRDHAWLNSNSFDYFAYIIAKPRNLFMHTGHDIDFELKSYDLITDLHYLLEHFDALENPLAKLFKMKSQPIQHYYSAENMVEYFVLRTELSTKNPKWASEFKGLFSSFDNMLKEECDLDFMLHEVGISLEKSLAALENIFPRTFDEEIRNLKLTENELTKSQFTNFDDVLIDEIQDFLMYYREDINSVKIGEIIYYGFKKYFDLGVDRVGKFKKLYDKHKKFIKLMVLLEKAASKVHNQEINSN